MPYLTGFEKKAAPPGLNEALDKLQKLLGPRFSTAEADRILGGKDFWPLTSIWFMEGKIASLPDAIVWPESADETAAIIKIAREYKVPVIPFGEGSGVLGGITAVNGGIVIDMKRMNRIIEIDEESLLVTVETGINGEILERKLQEKGFTYVQDNFQYSIIENYNARMDDNYILKRESWWKETLKSKVFGYNKN